MTQEEAIEKAKAEAIKNDWPWERPIEAKLKSRSKIISLFAENRDYWVIKSNCNSRGRNIIIHIDNNSDQVTFSAYAPR